MYRTTKFYHGDSDSDDDVVPNGNSLDRADKHAEVIEGPNLSLTRTPQRNSFRCTSPASSSSSSSGTSNIFDRSNHGRTPDTPLSNFKISNDLSTIEPNSKNLNDNGYFDSSPPAAPIQKPQVSCSSTPENSDSDARHGVHDSVNGISSVLKSTYLDESPTKSRQNRIRKRKGHRHIQSIALNLKSLNLNSNKTVSCEQPETLDVLMTGVSPELGLTDEGSSAVLNSDTEMPELNNNSPSDESCTSEDSDSSEDFDPSEEPDTIEVSTLQAKTNEEDEDKDAPASLASDSPALDGHKQKTATPSRTRIFRHSTSSQTRKKPSVSLPGNTSNSGASPTSNGGILLTIMDGPTTSLQTTSSSRSRRRKSGQSTIAPPTPSRVEVRTADPVAGTHTSSTPSPFSNHEEKEQDFNPATTGVVDPSIIEEENTPAPDSEAAHGAQEDARDKGPKFERYHEEIFLPHGVKLKTLFTLRRKQHENKIAQCSQIAFLCPRIGLEIYDSIWRSKPHHPLRYDFTKVGIVYIFALASHPGYFKIGKTSDLPEARKKQWDSKCDLKYTCIPDPNNKRFRHYGIVETLVHAELCNERIKVKCTKCNKTHIELFKVPVDRALEVVDKWRSWVINNNPYSYYGIVRETWKIKHDNAMDDNTVWENWHEVAPNQDSEHRSRGSDGAFEDLKKIISVVINAPAIVLVPFNLYALYQFGLGFYGWGACLLAMFFITKLMPRYGKMRIA